MTNDYGFFDIKPGTKIRILSEDGKWYEAKSSTYGAASPETQYEYPTTARRAFVNLAEAIRTSVENPKDFRDILRALTFLHVEESLRHSLVETYLYAASDDRQVIAEKLAALLDGQEKFHAGRFISHATSDSTDDNDGESGKWSYNRLNPEDAQKTTIEAVDEDGETTDTVEL